MLTAATARGRLTLWALLIPVFYAPVLLIGERPGPDVWTCTAVACVLAFGAWLAFVRTQALDGLARAVAPRTGLLLTTAVVAYVIVHVIVARARLAAFYDYNQLGLFTQSAWSTLHGHAFANNSETVDGTLGSHFGIHFSPTLLLLVPLYSVWRSPLALLAAQSLALGLAPVPLYHLLKREAGAAGALVLALALLAVPNFAWGGARDFHDLSFIPVLLLTVLWAIERGRFAVMIAAAIAALGVREDVGFTLALIGVYALLRGRGMRIALTIAALGLLWNTVVFRTVMPHFRSPGLWIDPSQMFEKLYGQWGATPVRGGVRHAHASNGAREDAAGARPHGICTAAPAAAGAAAVRELGVPARVPGTRDEPALRLGNMRDPSNYYSLMPLTVRGALGVPAGRR
jgi:hypothetical protein